MSNDIAIKVDNLTKIYKLYDSPQDRLKEALNPLRKKYHRDFYALNNVSFEVRKGETVGIIGQNGAGKSTLLKVITGVLTPTNGQVSVNGRISALLELGAGFNPDISGLENVYFNGTILGFSREEMDAKLDDILTFADIGNFIHQPVKIYSSGMSVRLAFSLATHIEPEILIVDEALSVGDVSFQAKCYDKIKSLMAGGTTTLFVTHNMQTITSLCDRAILLDQGKIFTTGSPKNVGNAYYVLQREREQAKQNTTGPSSEKLKRENVPATAAASSRSETLAGEKRFGTGSARIMDFKVYDHEQRETETLHTGKAFRVVIEVAFFEKVENPCFGLMVRSVQGQNLIGIHSYHNRRLNFGSRQGGDRMVVSFFGNMALNPGKYLLSLGVSDHTTDYDYTNIDARSNLLVLTVCGDVHPHSLIYDDGAIQVEDIRD
jgi:ABC-type polysaccharide/polyol phosphate transport system ATPase subunit